MNKIDPQSWKQDLPEFREKTAAFYAGELDKAAYKGFSGLYGSYAQKGGKASMLRLRMTAGRVTKEKLAFVAGAVREYRVPRAHFTTCQTIQLHDLDQNAVFSIMEKALDAGIVTMGGGHTERNSTAAAEFNIWEDPEAAEIGLSDVLYQGGKDAPKAEGGLLQLSRQCDPRYLSGFGLRCPPRRDV